MRIRVIVVDDHQFVIDGVVALLANEADIQVVGKIRKGAEALQLIPRLHPDVVILDKHMPDLDGFVVAQLVHQQYPKTHIVILSQYFEVGYAADALRKGAQAYVCKSEEPEYLVEAIRQVMRDQIYLSPPLSLEKVDNFRRKTRTGQLEPADTLTPTERVVFSMILIGLNSREIARRLKNSVRTIECHRSNILRKLMVSNTYELMRYAVEHGLMTPEALKNSEGLEEDK